MIRRKAAFAAGRYGNAQAQGGGDVNPLETVANLSDVMLVFAVALMLAIITLLGVDVSALSDLSDRDMQPVEADMSEGASQETMSGDSYEEVGTVYRDVNTGEMYLLSE